MEGSDPNAPSDPAWSTERSQNGSAATEHRIQPVLTRGQRWLAGATAGAVLLSGLNALVQVWRVATEWSMRHW